MAATEVEVLKIWTSSLQGRAGGQFFFVGASTRKESIIFGFQEDSRLQHWCKLIRSQPLGSIVRNKFPKLSRPKQLKFSMFWSIFVISICSIIQYLQGHLSMSLFPCPHILSLEPCIRIPMPSNFLVRSGGFILRLKSIYEAPGQ